MRILFIGYGSFVRRKALPGALACAGIDAVDIASRHGADPLPDGFAAKASARFDSYETALAESRANLVYISTVNSTHTEWAEKALDRGLHVIVDKPADISLEGARRLVKRARTVGRCLAEATVYPFHPLVETARRQIERDGPPRHLTAGFSFPPLPPDNFRYRPELGGGLFLDLGVYAMSPGRLFFPGSLLRVETVVTSRHPNGLETSFSVLLEYEGGRTLTGHFGFDTQYRNHLTLLGERCAMEIPRIYTPPPGQALAIEVQRGDRRETLDVPPADCFVGFYEKVLDSLRTGAYEAWSDILLRDAEAVDRLRKAEKGRG